MHHCRPCHGKYSVSKVADNKLKSSLKMLQYMNTCSITAQVRSDRFKVPNPVSDLPRVRLRPGELERIHLGVLAMESWRWSLVVVTVALATLQAVVPKVEAAPKGSWRVVTKNAGVASMHSAVTPGVGSLMILDHTNTGPSNITFPEGRCRNTTYDTLLKNDCFAHSVILNPVNGAVRPLMVMTDTWCSSGQFMADGSLLQTGGDKEGKFNIRSLSPACYAVEPVNKQCDWVQSNLTLRQQRWYATNLLLPDGRQLIFGGLSNSYSNEFAPPLPTKPVSRYMPFLYMTRDGPSCNMSWNTCTNNTKNGPNNFYPFAYLLPAENQIFLFANRDSIIYDYKNDVVVRTFPKIPGNPRNYPSGGSSVMLPLTWQSDYQKVEIVVCGGATNTNNVNANCSVTCGRMEVTSANPGWVMEDMPIRRCMGEMVLLPDASVLIINGAQNGYNGWTSATNPALRPVLYQPSKRLGRRFTVLAATVTPRMYHSTANLLTDGSVAVAGSNSHQYYTFKRGRIDRAVFFPTELSVEAFTPPYAQSVAGGRPTIVSVDKTVATYSSSLLIQFYDDITSQDPAQDSFLFTMNSPPWSTHSYSHGQRQVTLNIVGAITTRQGTDPNGVNVNTRTATVTTPAYPTVLPPAYYMLWVVKNGNPSVSCIWVQMAVQTTLT